VKQLTAYQESHVID